MPAPPPTLRQCADCYYRVESRCASPQAKPAPRPSEPDQHCEHFTRASLRFAFFPKM